MPSGLRPAVRGLCSTRRWLDAGWDKVGRFSEPVSDAKSDCETQKEGEGGEAAETHFAQLITCTRFLFRISLDCSPSTELAQFFFLVYLSTKTKYFANIRQRLYQHACIHVAKNRLERQNRAF